MGPERFGRTLGIGIRVASKILRDRAGQVAQGDNRTSTPSSAPSVSQTGTSEAVRSGATLGQNALRATARTATKTGAATKAAGRGAKGFGRAFWGPLRHISGVLWLEITGVFFALFALFFAQNIYRSRAAWNGGPEHTHFLLYVAFTILFGWFSLSSFLRARKREKKARQTT